MEKPFETEHRIILEDARQMENLGDRSIDLIVTSPPYPMIQMWDDLFSAGDGSIAAALEQPNAIQAFKAMHDLLDDVWQEVVRVLKPGGIACINIGDATRTFNGHFRLFANHAEIISRFMALGMTQLPTIIWRKSTNAPNKFMGSGMMPPGAYVTLEHEYVLIFRKGEKRAYPRSEQKTRRRRSAYFWEERNTWFSDVWTDLKGVNQDMDNASRRQRSAAFPFELPHRLISMFSVQGETVLDPFLGTGTTMLAAMCAARKSIGYESDSGLQSSILERVANIPEMANHTIQERLEAHVRFVDDRTSAKGAPKHQNRYYGFPVMTRQEEDLFLHPVLHVQYQSANRFKVVHGPLPDSRKHVRPEDGKPDGAGVSQAPVKGRQLKLF